MIPIAEPGRWYRQHEDEVESVVAAVITSGRYLLGEQTATFEARFAAFCQVPHCIAVSSGTDALYLALTVMDVGDGEVIVPSHTATATVAAIEQAGAIPVFVDIEAAGVCLSPEAVAVKITKNTRAIVAVHMFGMSADMSALRSLADTHGLTLIEDCAQAAGARHRNTPVGGFGDVGIFSFYPTKNIGAAGDAGAIVCRDGELAQQFYAARQYGWDEGRNVQRSGTNSRMDEIQAALLNLRLQYWDVDFARRQANAERLIAAVDNSSGLAHRRAGKNEVHAYHLFVVETEDPAELANHLQRNGISSAHHYPRPMHQEPYFAHYANDVALPNTGHLYQRMLTVPSFPELTDDELEQVCAALSSYY